MSAILATINWYKAFAGLMILYFGVAGYAHGIVNSISGMALLWAFYTLGKASRDHELRGQDDQQNP